MKLYMEFMIGVWMVNAFIYGFLHAFVKPSEQWFSRFALGTILLGILIICDYLRNILQKLNEEKSND